MYDYYGWKVSDLDPGPQSMMERGIDITSEGEAELKKISDLLTNKRTVVEAGVCYGFTTPVLSKHFNHVHTFDFPTDIFNCFVVNMHERQIENITIHPHGLGEKDMDIKIADRFQRKKFVRGSLNTSVVDASTELYLEERQYVSEQTYRVKPLDQLDLIDVDLIMIDTEGYELPVIKGATQTIQKYSPVLVVEFSLKKKLSTKYGYTYPELHNYLLDIGYVHERDISKVDRVYVRKA